MKTRLLVLSIAILCLSAAPASAAMYEMSSTIASQLRDVSYSDIVTTNNNLQWVGYNPGTTSIYGLGTYGAVNPMYYEVGFVGNLKDNGQVDPSSGGYINPDGYASVMIGAAWTNTTKYGTNNVLSSIQGLSGSFDQFSMPISNDNDDFWEYMLYVESTTGNYSTSWEPIAAGAQMTLLLGTGVNYSDLTDIGFGIRLNVASQGQTSDDFHTSVVPVPAAVILGILGIGVAGLKLRKYA